MHSTGSPSGGSALLSTLSMLFSAQMEAGDEDTNAMLTKTYHYVLESLKFSSAQQSFVGDSQDALSVEESMLK